MSISYVEDLVEVLSSSRNRDFILIHDNNGNSYTLESVESDSIGHTELVIKKVNSEQQ